MTLGYRLILHLCLLMFMSSQVLTASDAESKIPFSVAVVGQTVTLTCSLSTSSFPRWHHTPVMTSKRILFFNGLKMNGYRTASIKVSMTTSFDAQTIITSELTIRNVDLQHAGTYRCSAVNEDDGFREMEFVVLATSPVCTDSREDAEQLLDEFSAVSGGCQVNYSGSVHPVFRCLPESLSKRIDTRSFGSSGSTYEYEVNITRTWNNKSVSCEIQFERMSSIPFEYRFQWVSAPLNVGFGPSTVTVTPLNNTLVCSAVGNPAPTFTWTQLGESVAETDEAEFNVCNASLVRGWKMRQMMDVDVFTEGMQTFQCTSQSGSHIASQNYTMSLPYIGLMCGLLSVDGRPFMQTSGTADGGSTKTETTFLIAVTVVIVTLLICGCVIVALAIIVKLRSRPSEHTPAHQSSIILTPLPPPPVRKRFRFESRRSQCSQRSQRSQRRGPLSAIYDEISEAKIRGSGVNHYLEIIDNGSPVHDNPPLSDICEHVEDPEDTVDTELNVTQPIYSAIKKDKRSTTGETRTTCDGRLQEVFSDVIAPLQQLRDADAVTTNAEQDHYSSLNGEDKTIADDERILPTA